MTDLIKKLASWPLSLIAAFAKALGNSYGVLLLYCFFVTGTLAIATNLLNPAIWVLLGCCALSVFCVSSFMEGKALAKQMAKWLGVNPQGIRKFLKKFTYHFPNFSQATRAVFGAWRYILAPLTYVLGYTIPLLAASAKGATMAAGTIGTLTLIFTTVGLVTGPTGWIIAIAAFFGLGVFGASFCKEGFTFRHKFFYYCLSKENLLHSFSGFVNYYAWSPLQRLVKAILAPVGR